MADLYTLIAHLDDLLSPSLFADYCPNGLQVASSGDVATVVTGVCAHQELLERAAERGTDLVLVHHGLFWESAPRTLDHSP